MNVSPDNNPSSGATGSDRGAPLIVACPRCRKRGPWLEGRWKPFCSERCSLIDLGHWFDGNYRISEPLRPDHFAEFEELGDGVDPDQPDDALD